MECTCWSGLSSTTTRKKVVVELVEGSEFANKLQLLVQNQKPLGDHGMVVAGAYVEKILGSFVKALSILNSGESTGDICQSPMTTTQASSPFCDDRKSVDSNYKRKVPVLKDRRGYKRRKASNTLTKLTPKPVDDGYAWRKYGQKEILNAKHSRNYFRCTHKIDQGCLATKQIQKTDEDPPMYQTTYIGYHTCTDPLKPPQLILHPSPPPPKTNSHNIFNFKSSLNISPNNPDYHPLFTSFPSIKIESNQPSSSDQYIYTPDLSAFETSAPTKMLASSSESDHGDVISSVYSCTTSAPSSDLDLIMGEVDFDDVTFLDEGFF